ncbi:MAG: DUF6291 domain-containing protein [Planctomycetota bacterium]|jgi:hypothetical protein
MERKSFIIYKDALEILDELDLETSGKLFHAIKNYQKDGTEPEDREMRLLFFNFKQQFIRDQQKYDEASERNKENGKKGGRPVKAKETEITQSVFHKPKKADNDNGNGSVNDNVNVNDSVSGINKQKTPTLDQVIDKFISLEGTNEMAERYFSSNESRGWIYNGSPIINWEASIPAYIRAWKAKDNKQFDEHEKIAKANRERWQRERERFEQLNK